MRAGDLNAVFAALSDPTRRGILSRLTHGPCSVSELGAPFTISAPAISRHLTVLEQGGLIDRWKKGRTYYCGLKPEPLRLAADWIQEQTNFWKRQFDQLDEFLRTGDETWITPSPPEPTQPSGSATGSPPAPTKSSRPGRRPRR